MPEKILMKKTLLPNDEKILSAPYDMETHLPRVEVRVSAPKHLLSYVDVGHQEITGKPGNYLQKFCVKNRGDLPVFASLVELS